MLATSSEDPVNIKTRIAGLSGIHRDESYGTPSRSQRYLLINGVILSSAYTALIVYSFFDPKILTSFALLSLTTLLTIHTTLFVVVMTRDERRS